MSKRDISIRVPVLARVEGEGALELDIRDNAVTSVKLRIYEPPRYFEKFLEQRSYSEIPDLVARICGICPVAYQMSAVSAIEAAFGHDVTPWVRTMRRLFYCGEWMQSHSLHIHLLAAPDFLGFDSVTTMAQDYGDEVRRGLNLQNLGNRLIRLCGGRSVHPVGARAGGFHHAPKRAEVTALLADLEAARADSLDLVDWTCALPLPDIHRRFVSVATVEAGRYPMMGERIVSDAGLDISFEDYESRFREFQAPHSTALHSLLDEQPYLVGPLARLNLNAELIPDEIADRLANHGIAFPSDNLFHSIVARAIEISLVLHDAIEILRAYAPATPFTEIEPRAGTGFGCTEAPRGLLWQRFDFDADGRVNAARIVPPTSQNQAQIENDLGLSLADYGLDHDDDDLRLFSETVVRNYDPCISCATHFLKLKVTRR